MLRVLQKVKISTNDGRHRPRPTVMELAVRTALLMALSVLFAASAEGRGADGGLRVPITSGEWTPWEWSRPALSDEHWPELRRCSAGLATVSLPERPAGDAQAAWRSRVGQDRDFSGFYGRGNLDPRLIVATRARPTSVQ
jgi:hypothetical protein